VSGFENVQRERKLGGVAKWDSCFRDGMQIDLFPDEADDQASQGK